MLDSHVKSITDAFIATQYSGLKRLNLSSNELTDDAVTSIEEWCTDGAFRLDQLNLSRNSIWAKGGITLASILETSGSPLKVLDISWNKLGRGAEWDSVYVNKLIKEKKQAPRKDPSKLKKGEEEQPLTLLGNEWASAMT